MTSRTLTLGIVVLIALSGCARSSSTAARSGDTADVAHAPVSFAAGQYPAAFDAAREELRDLGFVLDRVDAQLGVITTLPKGSGGLATPWDREQSSIEDEVNDAVHRAQRVVRIEYVPSDSSTPATDLRSFNGNVNMAVGATLQRVNVPGWRLNTLGVLNSTYSRDPALDARGLSIYAVPIRQDSELAAWLARRIATRLETQPAASAPSASAANTPQ
ncbi:MAG: hypothetical protein K2W85_15210 [Phycisphaerales bacterium]|nr:hypothetical protein [Phycisphaerales bacterium]